MPESPYIIDEAAQGATMTEQADAKRRRPDGSVEPDGKVDPAAMREFLQKVGAIGDGGEDPLQRHVMNAKRIVEIDGETGQQTEHTSAIEDMEADSQAAIFQKVAYFLDPKLKGPVTLREARHKLFVLRVPVAQEMLDVSAFMGGKADATVLGIVGELLKAVVGWLPTGSSDAHLLRAHINDPKKWPNLRDVDWLATRDPFYLENEVIPLYNQYLEWRAAVVPTAEEIDFYYSRLG